MIATGKAATGRTLSARVPLVDEKMEVSAYMGTPSLGRAMILCRAE